MRKLRSGVMLALLLVCTLALTFRIQPARSSPATITVPDDYPTIQAAIDAASPGDTVFVRAGTYNCHIEIDKPLTLKGESSQNTILRLQGTANKVFGLHVTASDVTVSGFHMISPVAAPGGYVMLIVVDGRGGVTGDNCVIKDNVLEEYGTDALVLMGSRGDEVVGNVISSQDKSCMFIMSSSNCLVRNNSLSGSESMGIVLYQSSNNTVSNNFITNQIDSLGLQCGAITIATFSDSNTVRDNTLVNNDYGVSCWHYTQNNVIYHNNFVNNTHQACDQLSEQLPANFWDNGYPSGGNYWSDYNGTDLYSGPYQNGTGCDGIGDTSYVIDACNRDNYPLMGLFPARGDINGDGTVDGSDLIIIARAFGSYGPNYLYPGSPQHPRWNPDADVNSDGAVDGSDIILATRMFGHH